MRMDFLVLIVGMNDEEILQITTKQESLSSIGPVNTSTQPIIYYVNYSTYWEIKQSIVWTREKNEWTNTRLEGVFPMFAVLLVSCEL